MKNFGVPAVSEILSFDIQIHLSHLNLHYTTYFTWKPLDDINKFVSVKPVPVELPLIKKIADKLLAPIPNPPIAPSLALI